MKREITTTVCIEETVTQEFTVTHAEGEDPLEAAIGKYRAGEFVLAPGEVKCKRIAVAAPDGRQMEWSEF